MKEVNRSRAGFGSALSALSVLALAFAAPVHAADDDKISLDIDRQSISLAIVELSNASGVQIMLSDQISSALVVPEVQGDYSLESALRKMLDGSELTFEYVSENTILISRKPVLTDQGNPHNGAVEAAGETVLEEILVTGTRLRNQSPVSPITVVTRAEIDRRGFNSLEEVVRALPQNFSSFTAAGTLDNTLTPGGGIGQASANLRGLGTDATLVLVNGRRVAGSTAQFGEAVNLNTIPFGAIERVEVELGGTGAIYGSDAVAGTINIILKKDYTGAETTVRYENSSGGADSRTIEQTLGTAWNSGSLSAALSYKSADGLSAADVGITSRDFTDRGGFDRRFVLNTQSELFTPIDDVIPMLSSDADSWSATLNLQQDLGISSSVFADLIVSENDTSIAGGVPTSFGSVNALHPLGPGFARYSFIEEFEAGVIPRPVSGSKQERLHLNLGFETDLPFKDWRASMVVGYSEESLVTSAFGLDTQSPAYLIAALGQDIRFPEPGEDVTFIQPGDPFIDLFGPASAAAQNEDLLRSLVTDRVTNDEDSTTNDIEAYVEGALLDLPGGELRMVLGGQYRKFALDYSAAPRAAQSFSNLKPEQTLEAAFFEFGVPVVGEDNAFPGVKSLIVTASGRWDNYTNPDVQRREDVFETAEFDHFSPRFGMVWTLTDDLLLRASWGESFRAPGPFELNAPFFNFGPSSNPVDDPLTEDVVEQYFPLEFSEANPNLQPETSENTAIGLEWTPSFLSGLRAVVTFNRINYTNLITRTSVFSLEELLSDPELVPGFAVRDPVTNEILELHRFPINIAGRFSESVDVDILYEVDTGVGTFAGRLFGTYTIKLEDIAREGFEPDRSHATQSGPDRVKGSVSLDWYRDNYGATVVYNYSSGYTSNRFFDREIFEFATEEIDSYATVDVSGFYRLPASGWQFRGGVRNLTDSSMPFLRGGFALPYDPTRVDPEGRVIFAEVRKSFDL